MVASVERGENNIACTFHQTTKPIFRFKERILSALQPRNVMEDQHGPAQHPRIVSDRPALMLIQRPHALRSPQMASNHRPSPRASRAPTAIHSRENGVTVSP